MPKKLTFQEFVDKARAVHGDKYEYSLVEYVDAKTKVKIICPIHGEFEQVPNTHLSGAGCQKCGIESIRKKLSDSCNSFILKAKNIHGNKYDYSLVNYTNNRGKVKITCPIHGIFEQTPTKHVDSKCGCQKCGAKETANRRLKNVLPYDDAKLNILKLKLSNKEDWKNYCKSEEFNAMLPKDPSKKYKNKGWISWGDFLGNNNIATFKRLYGTYEESKKIVSFLNINSQKDWQNYCKSGLKPKKIPSDPYKVYQNSGWISWGDFFSTGYISTLNREYLSFEDAKEIVNLLNLKSRNEWSEYCYTSSKPDNIPNTPSQVYKDSGWTNWYDFLGTKKDFDGFVNYCEAKNFVKELDFKSKTEWFLYCKTSDRPTYIPSNPARFYENNGWVCWSDFLGCNGIFTFKFKLSILNTLEQSDLLTMDPIELFIIIGQGNLPSSFGSLVNTDAESEGRIATLQEIRERLETETGKASTDADDVDTGVYIEPEDEFVQVDEVDDEITSNITTPELRLPSVSIINDLHSLDNSLYATVDEEAMESLVQYKLRKLWNKVLNNEISIESLVNEVGGRYFTSIKDMFLEEYNDVMVYRTKDNYSFRYEPNLMQKLTVHRMIKNQSYGNWSGTGAGKTLSFILASRETDSRLTLVIALNSTIRQTAKAIKEVYPDSLVFTDYRDNFVFDRSKYNYLVLNYEKFQQGFSEELCQSLTNNNQVDFVVIDEVHNAKQREEDNESIRRAVMNRLLGRIRENNPNLYSLVMSATPVINNLYEAKSLLNLMTGLEYDDLKTRRTLPNALKTFQQLILNGLRFIPKYDINITELTGQNMTNLNIDGSHLLDDLLALSGQDYISAEKLLLEDKLNAIAPYLKSGVVIYTYFTTGIVNKIEDFVTSLGFKVGTYTGDESPFLRDKNLQDFVEGKIDILIGSKPIGTGVDGLQEVCDRMIAITLPWTDSEYTQLKGRIYRQGSIFNDVEIIIPQIKIELENEEFWSWDIQRLNLIKHKRTLADAAVDGIIPSKTLPTPETMFKKSQQSLQKWKERIENGNIIESSRNQTKINLYPELIDEEQRKRRIESELSDFNRRGKTTLSSTMHKEFTDNPDSWFRYHALRAERMREWGEIPYEYIATKIKNRNHIVADFGCGENKMRHCIPNNKVYAFDHIACDETVTACDMKNTGLENESVDIAVFSLALWGTNYRDYIKEAYRVLSYGGQIHIAEPAKNYETIESEQELVDLIGEVGFKVVGKVERRHKFIYVTGIKI